VISATLLVVQPTTRLSGPWTPLSAASRTTSDTNDGTYSRCTAVSAALPASPDGQSRVGLNGRERDAQGQQKPPARFPRQGADLMQTTPSALVSVEPPSAPQTPVPGSGCQRAGQRVRPVSKCAARPLRLYSPVFALLPRLGWSGRAGDVSSTSFRFSSARSMRLRRVLSPVAYVFPYPTVWRHLSTAQRVGGVVSVADPDAKGCPKTRPPLAASRIATVLLSLPDTNAGTNPETG